VKVLADPSRTRPQKVGGPIAHPSSKSWLTHPRTRQFFGGSFGEGFTPPQKVWPTSAHPSVFFGGILVEFLAGSLAASKRLAGGKFWREVWVKVPRSLKKFGGKFGGKFHVASKSLAGSFTQPQKVWREVSRSLKKFWREVSRSLKKT